MKRILLATKDPRTHALFKRQLNDFFQESVCVLEGMTDENVDTADVILTTYLPLVPPSVEPSKVIQARRTVDYSKLEQMVQLDKQATCYVVNNTYDSAVETISLLKNLGYDFEMVPYYPGVEVIPGRVRIALAPDASHGPPGVQQIIPIGFRPLDISTLVEVGFKLELSMERAPFYTARASQEIVRLSRRLSHTLCDVTQLHDELTTLLNVVKEGIVTADADGCVTRVNQAARTFLGVDLKHAVGMKLSELSNIWREPFAAERPFVNKVCSNGRASFVVNEIPIESDATGNGIVFVLQDASDIQSAETEIRRENRMKGLAPRYQLADIVGDSQALVETKNIVRKVANVNSTVVLYGETGTGKELFAHSIHQLSPRRTGPFLPVNFAGLPESLAESELFGYEEGTFTGGKRGGKPGLFELAHRGTIFLDEIGDATLGCQALLLRVLQENQVMRVGGRKLIPVDVRVIAATNKDLEDLVRLGRFREDLYYRLCVLPVHIPPLRARKEDIPLLLNHFSSKRGQTQIHWSDEVLAGMQNYHWPGNIRELVSVFQYAVTVAESDTVQYWDLPPQLQKCISKRYNELITALADQGDLSLFCALLEQLLHAQKAGKSIGRRALADALRQMGISVSEQQIRHRMGVFEKLGIVEVGRKKQGTRLTREGQRAYEAISLHLSRLRSNPLVAR